MAVPSVYSGEEIKELIPQRPPILMVGAFAAVSETVADSSLYVADDNFFCYGGFLAEPGIMEHIAQTASALAGYSAKLRGLTTGLGYIGEIKKARIAQLPPAGSTIKTHIEFVSETLGITLLTAITEIEGGGEVCSCTMKISMKE